MVVVVAVGGFATVPAVVAAVGVGALAVVGVDTEVLGDVLARGEEAGGLREFVAVAGLVGDLKVKELAEVVVGVFGPGLRARTVAEDVVGGFFAVAAVAGVAVAAVAVVAVVPVVA